MKSTAARQVLATAIVLVASGCGTDATPTGTTQTTTTATTAALSAAAPSTAGLPTMPERYGRTLTRAFATASEGRSPTMACTSVIAMAAGNTLPEGVVPAPDSVRAFELCYIDVGARYIDALLAQIAAGGAKLEVCPKIAAYAVITRTSLGSFADNVRLDVATLDQRLLERVQPGLQATCPDQVEAISGYR